MFFLHAWMEFKNSHAKCAICSCSRSLANWRSLPMLVYMRRLWLHDCVHHSNVFDLSLCLGPCDNSFILLRQWLWRVPCSSLCWSVFKSLCQESWRKMWQAIEDVLLARLPETPSLHRWTACGLAFFRSLSLSYKLYYCRIPDPEIEIAVTSADLPHRLHDSARLLFAWAQNILPGCQVHVVVWIAMVHGPKPNRDREWYDII